MALSFTHFNSNHFYPLTLTRKLQDIRIGILTIREKWQLLNIHGEINTLQLPSIVNPKEKKELKNIVDIVQLNDWAIRQDHALITKGNISAPISSTNTIINAADIFIEEGAEVEHCFLNAANGPIYIGKNVIIMEGSMLRGPVAICENSLVKMGTKLYGGTTIGPFCTVGGEIKNAILTAYSNKAHEGYLGDSIIGEWCNLGAGTSNSNLKNTAGNIKIKLNDIEIDAGVKFGLLMGDYSRTAINTSFNTGTVVGVCCNIFSNGLTPRFIPSFSWGCNDEIKYDLPKALIDINNWKKMKGKNITDEEKEMLAEIYTTSR